MPQQELEPIKGHGWLWFLGIVIIILALILSLSKKDSNKKIQRSSTPESKKYDLARRFDLSTEEGQRQFKLASAIKLYKDGYRTRAVSELKALAKEYPSSLEGMKARNILAPPPIGRREFNVEPFRFKGTRGGEMGVWGKSKGVDIKPLYVDVDQNAIKITFSIRAGDAVDMLLYAPKTWEEQFGISGEGLYILDDNGGKFYSTTGFVGGRQSDFNNRVKLIKLNPYEEVIIYAEFPMISEGATTIKFVSPMLNGWQSEWWWSGIKLKQVRFD